MNKKNYYFYYLSEFLKFLIPVGKSVLRIEIEDGNLLEKTEVDKAEKDSLYDYAVATDVLGYVGDVQIFLEQIGRKIKSDGRIIITQSNPLWGPLLRLASKLGLRTQKTEQNWLLKSDLKNFAFLAGLETVKCGTKILMPKYIPMFSIFLNKIIANIFPFSKLGLFHYVVVRKQNTEYTKQTKPSLSIIVPARNESGTVEKIINELPSLGSFTEIIFIEGGSSDDTYENIIRLSLKYKNKIIRYAKQEGKGKGDAVRKGFEIARGDILAIYDADMTVPADELEKFYSALAENKADFINGSRLVYPLEKDSMRALNYLGNKFFSFAFSSILGQELRDTLCGTKVLWKKDYEYIKKNRAFFGDFDPFGDFDLLFGASKINLKIIDMPVHYKERVYGKTNISRWKHGWLLLKMTIFAVKKIKFI